MSAPVPPEPCTVEALSAGLLSTDASRRVGWAKAFDRHRRIEDLEQQLSAAQSELTTLRDSYVRLVNFTAHLPVSRPAEQSTFDGEVALHKAAIASYQGRRSVLQGKRLADQVRAEQVQAADARANSEVLAQKREEAHQAFLSDLAELKASAVALGHTAWFAAQPDGSFACECSCGKTATAEVIKDAQSWVDTHRADVVHGGIKEWRKRRKQARNHERCVCETCGDVHGIKHVTDSEVRDGA